METGRRNKMDTEKILENLSDMGCDDKQICFMKKMYEEGNDSGG